MFVKTKMVKIFFFTFYHIQGYIFSGSAWSFVFSSPTPHNGQ